MGTPIKSVSTSFFLKKMTQNRPVVSLYANMASTPTTASGDKLASAAPSTIMRGGAEVISGSVKGLPLVGKMPDKIVIKEPPTGEDESLIIKMQEAIAREEKTLTPSELTDLQNKLTTSLKAMTQRMGLDFNQLEHHFTANINGQQQPSDTDQGLEELKPATTSHIPQNIRPHTTSARKKKSASSYAEPIMRYETPARSRMSSPSYGGSKRTTVAKRNAYDRQAVEDEDEVLDQVRKHPRAHTQTNRTQRPTRHNDIVETREASDTTEDYPYEFKMLPATYQEYETHENNSYSLLYKDDLAEADSYLFEPTLPQQQQRQRTIRNTRQEQHVPATEDVYDTTAIELIQTENNTPRRRRPAILHSTSTRTDFQDNWEEHEPEILEMSRKPASKQLAISSRQVSLRKPSKVGICFRVSLLLLVIGLILGGIAFTSYKTYESWGAFINSQRINTPSPPMEQNENVASMSSLSTLPVTSPPGADSIAGNFVILIYGANLMATQATRRTLPLTTFNILLNHSATLLDANIDVFSKPITGSDRIKAFYMIVDLSIAEQLSDALGLSLKKYIVDPNDHEGNVVLSKTPLQKTSYEFSVSPNDLLVEYSTSLQFWCELHGLDIFGCSSSNSSLNNDGLGNSLIDKTCVTSMTSRLSWVALHGHAVKNANANNSKLLMYAIHSLYASIPACSAVPQLELVSNLRSKIDTISSTTSPISFSAFNGLIDGFDHITQ